MNELSRILPGATRHHSGCGEGLGQQNEGAVPPGTPVTGGEIEVSGTPLMLSDQGQGFPFALALTVAAETQIEKIGSSLVGAPSQIPLAL